MFALYLVRQSDLPLLHLSWTTARKDKKSCKILKKHYWLKVTHVISCWGQETKKPSNKITCKYATFISFAKIISEHLSNSNCYSSSAPGPRFRQGSLSNYVMDEYHGQSLPPTMTALQ